MLQYHMIRENRKATHECDANYERIEELCVYVYGCWPSDILPGIIDNMKEGQTLSHTFPNGEKITITALEDIFLPF